ncbi:CDP-glycerol--glycerophosphate glycerophosphotransferase [Ferrimonas sediminicola]|uniref:CDP-glycerol--glycerophosphate glycerophosphotransferase n=1 Tax=Ferrimonas sediminicola TaxID=2569538 RepID=A0A4U1B9W6_9GAMM|nr:CDP-glycerol--glycerophosphate glycerophosphotransferase [Ferrimonas sediminicola]TKB47589.1 CDP-glycerol--glycerophosphate glycerophosphotransferase [Ferrimonas sediminicola]
MKKYLFYVELPYTLSILRPLQAEIRARGDQVKWFIAGDRMSPVLLAADEERLESVAAVKAYDPYAVFVPGNVVADFFPGIKVQVFHGLEWKKRGHFGIRGFFDLYCTHGPITTDRFNELGRKHGYFRVRETGWPKMDPYLGLPQPPVGEVPVIVYAPTFSPSLTSVPDLYEPIKRLSQAGRYRFVVKFHPKMEQGWIDKYRAIQGPCLEVSDDEDLLRVYQQGNLVLSDTSSAVTEALMMGKVVVTYRNSQPQPCLLDFDQAQQLGRFLELGLHPSEALREEIDRYVGEVHPNLDGHSSARILAAVDEVAAQGVLPKPLNLIRRFKVRKRLGYYRWS